MRGERLPFRQVRSTHLRVLVCRVSSPRGLLRFGNRHDPTIYSSRRTAPAIRSLARDASGRDSKAPAFAVRAWFRDALRFVLADVVRLSGDVTFRTAADVTHPTPSPHKDMQHREDNRESLQGSLRKRRRSSPVLPSVCVQRTLALTPNAF